MDYHLVSKIYLLNSLHLSLYSVATLQWFKDGVMIREGNTFTVTRVTDSDRGHYTANISNIAGNMTIEYVVLIRCKSY